MPFIEQVVGTGIRAHRIKEARGRYDFSVNGGAVSTIGLMAQTGIPLGSTILFGFIDVLTALTSGGSATIAVQAEAANDVLPAIAVATWTTGRKKVIPSAVGANDLSASNVLRTTAARDISIVIAVAALTAGKFDVVLFYLDPLS